MEEGGGGTRDKPGIRHQYSVFLVTFLNYRKYFPYLFGRYSSSGEGSD
jgi:hypothetical protein